MAHPGALVKYACHYVGDPGQCATRRTEGHPPWCYDATMTDELATLDATAQAELVRRCEVQPLELVDAAIARIERLNPALNAVITPLFDQARARAASPDLPEGPFRGVPILLKDYLCHTAGDPYFEGMRILRDLGWR